MTTDELLEKLPGRHPVERGSHLELTKDEPFYVADYNMGGDVVFYNLGYTDSPAEALQALYERMVEDGHITEEGS